MTSRPTPSPTDLRVALGTAVVAGQRAQAAAVVGQLRATKAQ